MNPKVTKQILLAGFLCGLFFVWIWPFLPFNAAAKKRAAQARFREEWAGRFRRAESPQEIKFPPAKQVSFQSRRFGDGSWVAIAWHSMHTYNNGGLGDEWDGSVLWDSNEKLFWTEHHFCGYEGFAPQFLHVKAGSLSQFYLKTRFSLEKMS